MALFTRQPKRSVPQPELISGHPSNNPLFPRPTLTVPAQFRAKVLWWFLAVLGMLLVGFAIYGPWLRVAAIEITGTQALDPQSVKKVANQLIDQRRWLILPNRNTWVLSSHWLGQTLRDRISQRLSIERVDVAKHYPHRLSITVHERIAAFRWSSAGQVAVVDRHGVVMTASTLSDQDLPLVIDEADMIMGIDHPVVKEEVVAALQAISTTLAKRQIKVEHYTIPAPVCPTVLPPQSTTTFIPTSNLNANLTILNANENDNVQVEANANVAQIPPCDLAQLHFSSQEVHLKLDRGPAVYFDRHQNLSQAVEALARVLDHPTAPITSYIDLRFGDRVYIK